MNTALPLCCNSEAFNLLARLTAAIESPDALVQGAVAISMHQMENVKADQVDLTLQRYADTVRSRVRGSQPQALLAHLHEFLFEEEEFLGNAEDYYNTSNNYLPEVLRHEARPAHYAEPDLQGRSRAFGPATWGVGLPGHFLVGVEAGGSTMLVDPFAGGIILTSEEAHERMMEMLGPEVEWSDDLLAPVSNRHWLTRMLQNLLHTFGNSAQFADVAAVLELEMVLWPKRNQLQRDLALVLARCGLSQPASVWLDKYLKNNPDDPQRTELAQLLDVLK